MVEQTVPPAPEKKESLISRVKSRGKEIKEKTVQTGRTVAEKGAKAKDCMAGKLGRIDAENCTLKEAMTKIEEEVFAGTKILEDLNARFMGSARKLRDQIARRTAKVGKHEFAC